MDEKQLIISAKNGDKAAFEQLILQYQSKVYNLAYKLLSNYTDASDAAQDAFLKLYKSLGSFREQSSLSTWIYRITYNVCVDRMRQIKRTPVSDYDESLADTSASPEAYAINNENKQIIYDAINKLPYEYRAAVILRDINGHSYDEIAYILGCSTRTVNSRINRRRGPLQEFLSVYLEPPDT